MPKSVLSVEDCEEILDREDLGYLGLSREGQPYCIPFNFLYSKGRIYIHTGLKGMKWDYLAENPKACFAVCAPGAKKTGESPCRYSYLFESVVAFGEASEIKSETEVREALAKLVDKYRVGPVIPIPEEKLGKLRMIRLDVQKLSGLRNV